ncbi:MAG: alginate export family protein [Candidatus Nitrotoga sp.]
MLTKRVTETIGHDFGCAALVVRAGRLVVGALLVVSLLTPVNADELAPSPPPTTSNQAPIIPTNKQSYAMQPLGYRMVREQEPPAYVEPLSATWLNRGGVLDGADWVDIGLQNRLRYEMRDNDFRRATQANDHVLLERTRFFLGLKNKTDPLRLTLELQDSRRFGSVFAPDNKDANKLDVIRGYGELYFKDALGTDAQGNNRPVSVQVGRQNLEVTNKQLISSNEWRNTTNTFQGVRTILGQDNSDWQANVFAYQPLIRLIDKQDTIDRANWFYGAVLDWRTLPVTLQPYYYLLKQDASKMQYYSSSAYGEAPTTAQRVNMEVKTSGLRSYGVVGQTGLDYDFNYARQNGTYDTKIMEAYTYTLEGGYTMPYAWRPRLSAVEAFASGDRNSNDSKYNHFNKLYGFAKPLSNGDSITLENIRATKLRIEIQPGNTLKIDSGWSWYQLASATDAWTFGTATLQDKTGRAGTNIGQEFDLRVQHETTKNLKLEVGMTHFMAGSFTQSQMSQHGRSAMGNFFYVQTTLKAF